MKRRQRLDEKSYYNERVCLLIPELCDGTILVTTEIQPWKESSVNPSSSPSLSPNTAHPTRKQQRRRPTPTPQFAVPAKTNVPTIQFPPSIPLSLLHNDTLEPSLSLSSYKPIFNSQSPTFEDSLIQSSMAPSYPRNSRSCPTWRDSTRGERIQIVILEFTYTVQITSLVATFLPEMEDLILQVAADQTLTCQQPKLGIVRLSYPDPGSSLSVCSPSVPEAQTCWMATSSIRVYYDESNISRDTSQRNVWNAIREEFDFGDRIHAIIPNQVQVELWEATHSIKYGWGRGAPSRLSVGASIGIVILLWTIIWAAGATIKVQLWRSANTRRLIRRKDRSFRRTPNYHHYSSSSRFVHRNLIFGTSSRNIHPNTNHDHQNTNHEYDDVNDEEEEEDWMVSDDDDDDDGYDDDNFDSSDDDDMIDQTENLPTESNHP